MKTETLQKVKIEQKKNVRRISNKYQMEKTIVSTKYVSHFLFNNKKDKSIDMELKWTEKDDKNPSKLYKIISKNGRSMNYTLT